MSSASTKDVAKAINAFLPNASLPLPDELTEVIDAYLEKHNEEGASERLQEELLSIWEKTVKENKASYAPWLVILRRLLPALRNPTYLLQWWDQMTEPVLENLAQDRSLAKEAWASTLAFLTHDRDGQSDQEEGASQIATRLLKISMQNSQSVDHEGESSGLLKAKLVHEGLLNYGKKRPKELLFALDGFVAQREYRPQALTLLCQFLQSQPPHLHLVLETPLFDNILRCLQNDTSTTVVTLAVTALTMLLPNLPSSLVPYLPRLFNVYARLLFWDRERSLAADNPEKDAEDGENSPLDWERCEYSPDIDDVSIPNLLSYFTILYGLYPLNFVDYIRKPQRYLRHANMPNPDDIEVQPSEIRQKSERFRQYHVLHPNFYNLTSESEKTDFSRWVKSEASEVVADCTALCLATELGGGNEVVPSHGLGLSETDSNAKAGADQAFLTGKAILERTSSRDLAASFRNSTSGSLEEAREQASILRRSSLPNQAPSLREAFQSRSRHGPGDSPTLPPSLVLSGSHTNLRDMIYSNKVIKSGLHQSLTNDSVPSLALSHQESNPEKTTKAPGPDVQPSAPDTPVDDINEQIGRLYKKILLLNNDLSFERYMKQQHMIHIGELKRRQLKEAATEAETQNLIMVNRNLRNRIEEAKKSELRAKKESENRRNIAKKWETDLSAKLKLLREEQKKWNSEGAALKRELEAKMEECEKLTRMVCGYETTELNSKQNLQAITDHIQEISRLKAEVNRLIEVEQIYQSKEKETDARLAEAAESISKAEVLSMKLDAREAEGQEAKKLYESQIAELNSKLQDALQKGASRPKRDSDSSKVVESTLAASRAKMAELQKQHSLLARKYTVLQSSLLDMTANAKSPSHSTTPRLGGIPNSSDAEVSAIVRGGDPPSPLRRRPSRGRGLSDPELFVEGTRYNVTPPLDMITASSSLSTVLYHPSTPTGGGLGTSSGAERSPSDRYLGRSSAQGSSRKEKKEKKSSGIRGFRGFG